MRRIQIQRALLRYLTSQNGSSGARSFVSRSLASGYSYASPPERLEKKMERLLVSYLDAQAGNAPEVMLQGSRGFPVGSHAMLNTPALASAIIKAHGSLRDWTCWYRLRVPLCKCFLLGTPVLLYAHGFVVRRCVDFASRCQRSIWWCCESAEPRVH